jgi:hypothetical protein
MKNKKTLANHFKTCKIKNGGMAILFKTIAELKHENAILKQEVKKNTQHLNGIPPNIATTTNNINNINNTTNTIGRDFIMNHHNTVLNLTLENYGGKVSKDLMMEIIEQEAPRILMQEQAVDISRKDQVKARIHDFVGSVYRNPKYKQMQNVYVTDPQQETDNAFKYDKGQWHITDWSILSKELLRKIYDAVFDAENVQKKDDVMKIMKYIFIMTGIGAHPIETMTPLEIENLYLEIGKQLQFSTIINPALPQPI